MNQRRKTTKESLEKTAARKFFFVGNVLALDLLNTEVVIRGKKRDLLRGFQAMLPDVGVAHEMRNEVEFWS